MIDKFSGDHEFLSNFYPHPFYIYGLRFATVEHAFQAYKMTNAKDARLVYEQPTPGLAKRLARSLPKRDDWEQIKNRVMYECCREKFYDPHLGRLLQATCDEELVEGNTWGDHYWGVCKGVGQNHLGQILMRIRTELR